MIPGRCLCVSTIQTVVLTADVFQFFIKNGRIRVRRPHGGERMRSIVQWSDPLEVRYSWHALVVTATAVFLSICFFIVKRVPGIIKYVGCLSQAQCATLHRFYRVVERITWCLGGVCSGAAYLLFAVPGSLCLARCSRVGTATKTQV